MMRDKLMIFFGRHPWIRRFFLRMVSEWREDLVDDILRQHGYDPDEVARRGRQYAEDLLAKQTIEEEGSTPEAEEGTD